MDDATGLQGIQLVLVSLIGLVSIIGMALHVRAWKYRKPGAPRIGLKDSLLRHREMLYEPEGQRLIRLQRALAAVFALLLLALMLVSGPAGDT